MAATRIRSAIRAAAQRRAASDPADAAATAALDDLLAAAERAFASGRTILVGPWHSEVGFELLYWIPFLRWAIAHEPGMVESVVVVSRGGVGSWYDGINARYIDLFDLVDAAELARRKVQASEAHSGKQKQARIDGLDRELIERAREAIAAPQLEVLHPSVIYRAYKRLWKLDAVERFAEVSAPALLRPPAITPPAPELPDRYVAVRWYFSAVLPDAPQTRRAIARIVAELVDRTPVVLLDPALRIDDHSDFDLSGSGPLIASHHLSEPRTNLAVQTDLIARSSGFVGTYGGLSYLPPLLGRPSTSYFTHPGGFNRCHLDRAADVFGAIGAAQFAAHRLEPGTDA